MRRLCKELSSKEFAAAHPVLQAAYSHYCLVAIHPFADGNGRVARALASVYLYRAASIPLLILFDNRSVYFDALTQADTGNPQVFVDFVMDRAIDAFMLVSESLRAAQAPSPEELLTELDRLYGSMEYSYREVEVAGQVLFSAIQKAIDDQANDYRKSNHIIIHLSSLITSFPEPPPGYRNPVTEPMVLLQINFQFSVPATTIVRQFYCCSFNIRNKVRVGSILARHCYDWLRENLG